MFTVALFTKAKIWKQPKCPLIARRYGFYIPENITQPLKKWNLAICDNMDGPTGYYANLNKLDSKTGTVWSHFYVKSKTKRTKTDS